jgi:hypothetical protein
VGQARNRVVIPTHTVFDHQPAAPYRAAIEREPANKMDLEQTYRIHIRSDEFQFESEIHATQVDREDGWTVFWHGNDVFLRIRDAHIVSLEHLV